jgi:hypothetical protein
LLLKLIDPNPTFAPEESSPMPERLIAGAPHFKTWAQDVAKGELVHTGASPLGSSAPSHPGIFRCPWQAGSSDRLSLPATRSC